MRKVLSFVLVLALVLGSFSMAFAATPAKGFSDTDAEAVSVLADLGVINGYADGTFKPGNVVTRAEMAKLIIVSLGLEKFATATTSKYTDMAGAGWAQGYVAYATSLGIIVGYPDGTFGPSNPVTYNEACAMIVRALGYTADFLPGEWPAEWVVKAQTLGILDGVNAGGAAGATRGNIAEMLYNALTLDIGYVDKDGVFQLNGTAKDPDNMLVRLGAQFVEAAVITGEEDTAINIRPYVGAYAETYLNDDDEIISVVVKSDFLTGTFEENTYDNGGTFKTVDDVEYKVSEAVADPTTGTAFEFYNGDYYDADNTLYEWTGYEVTIAADLSGKTIKEVYSIDEWIADGDFLFTADMKDEIADDQTLDSLAFALDDNDEIDLNSFELLGVDSLDAIKKDNVVFVYCLDQNDANDISRIEVGTETVTGKITRISGDDYTINGKVYNKSDVNFIGDELKLGDKGTAKLDYYGDIYDWDIEDATADNYAIVEATNWVTPSAFDNSQIKLITADGTETIYDVEDDADITSVSGIATDDLITFALNKDGNIDEIKECVLKDGTTGADKLNAARTIYDGKVLDSAVIVFTYDTVDGYDVAKLSTVDTDTVLGAKYYSPGSKIEVLVVKAANAEAGDTVYAVINTVSSALNADDEKVQYVEGFANGKALAAYTDSKDMITTVAFNEPTIYKLTLDADKVITSAKAYTTTVAADLAFMPTSTVADKDGSYLVKIGDQWYSIDANTAVYQLSYADDEYTLKTISAVKTDATVTMWQTDDDSEVFDLIVVEK